MENIITITSIPKNDVMAADTARTSFHGIYQRYQSLIRSVLFKISGPAELDDLVQETFIRVWRGQGQFKQESQLKTWIYRIAVHVAIDHQRKGEQKFPKISLTEEMPDQKQNGNGTELSNRDWVQKCLESLTPLHRTVLVLHCMEGLSIEEIAVILKTAKGTIKSRLFYAKKLAEEQFKKMGVTL